MTKTNSNSLSNGNLNTYTQPAEDRIAALILDSDGRWQQDDANYTDLPTFTTAISANQKDYELAVAFEKIIRAEIQDSNGNWRPLDTWDLEDEPQIAISEFETTTGVPTRYRVIGRSVILDPIPDYSRSAALKLFTQRGPLKYDYSANSNAGQFTDGTGTGATSDIPGFSSLFHELIALIAAYDYAVANSLKNANQIFVAIDRRERDLKKFYAKRNKDDRPIMSMKRNLYI